MSDFTAFRQDLAASLLACADRRRDATAREAATGQDIKVIALLQRLAEEVRTEKAERLGLSEPIVSRLGINDNHDLLNQVGVLFWPPNAADLICWLLRHASADDPRHPSAADRPSDEGRPSRGRGPDIARVCGARDANERCPSLRLARDLSAGFGIIAPVIALREIGHGIGQCRDRAVADQAATIPATVMSAQQGTGLRTSGLYSKVTLSFRLPGSSDTCRVPVPSAYAQGLGPGSVLAIVPRSGDCEPPLIRSEIGDPFGTFVIAAALLVLGAAALKRWDRLERSAVDPSGPRHRPVRACPSAAGRRGLLA